MLNENIIKEFQRLIAFKKSEKEEFIKIKDTKNITAYNFRLKQLNSVLIIFKNYPDKITLKNYLELKDIDGIGANTIQRIKEILESGKLSELNDFQDLSIEKEKIIEELEEVIGIGRTLATEFYNQGIKSVKILKQKIKKKEFVVNEKIELGSFAIANPEHVAQPLIQLIVDDLLGRGTCPSTGESARRTSVVMDRVLEDYYGGRTDAFWLRPATWPGRSSTHAQP